MQLVRDQCKGKKPNALFTSQGQVYLLRVANSPEDLLHLGCAHSDAVVLYRYLLKSALPIAASGRTILKLYADVPAGDLRSIDGICGVLNKLLQGFQWIAADFSEDFENSRASRQ